VESVTPYRKAKLEAGIEKTVAVDGRTYHYWDRGEGPALLLLHGLGGSAYDWRFVYDDLVAAGFRALAWEMLGAGYSDKPPEDDYRVPAQADRAARFLEAIGVAKAHVLGNSYGGALGLRLAAQYAPRVDRLVLLDPASMPQDLPMHVRVLRARGFAEVAVNVPPKKWLIRRTLREVFADPEKIREEDVEEYAHEASLPGAARAMMATARQIEPEMAGRYAATYKRIQSPTLILWGEEDRVTPLRCGHQLRELIPGALLRPLPRCGHCPHMEYPGSTLLAILDFLGAAPARAAEVVA